MSHISMKMSSFTKNAVTLNSGLLDYLVPSFSLISWWYLQKEAYCA